MAHHDRDRGYRDDDQRAGRSYRAGGTNQPNDRAYGSDEQGWGTPQSTQQHYADQRTGRDYDDEYPSQRSGAYGQGSSRDDQGAGREYPGGSARQYQGGYSRDAQEYGRSSQTGWGSRPYPQQGGYQGGYSGGQGSYGNQGGYGGGQGGQGYQGDFGQGGYNQGNYGSYGTQGGYSPYNQQRGFSHQQEFGAQSGGGYPDYSNPQRTSSGYRGQSGGYGASQFERGAMDRGASYDYSQGAYSAQQRGFTTGYAGSSQSSGFGGSAGAEQRRRNGPKGYKRSDDQLKDQVAERLMQSDIDIEDVECDVKDGVVTLSGTVCSRHCRHSAEDIADSVWGVKEVTNNLRIADKSSRQSGSMGDRQGSSGSASTAGSAREANQSSQAGRNR